MVSVGYGDITPKNSIELMSGIGIILLECIFFSYCVGEISSIFNEAFLQSRVVSKQLETVNKFLRKKQISQHLQDQVREYLEFYLREINSEDSKQEKAVLGHLSE